MSERGVLEFRSNYSRIEVQASQGHIARKTSNGNMPV